MKTLQIFKAGKHTASDGRVITFTDAQVKATAAAYNPELHEAPIVIGHPKSDAPAFGWAKALSFSSPILIAEPHQLHPDLPELVKSGAVKKISASFYEPDAPNNPVPGVYYLRHIGLLGAQAPAIKGLKSAEFTADEKGVIEFMDWTTRDIATMFRSLRDWIISKYGKDEADKVIPDWTVQSVSDAALKIDEPDAVSGVSYSERNDNVLTKEELDKQKRELDAKAEEQRKAEEKKNLEFAEREKTLKASEATQRRIVIVGEIDALVALGKILPKDKPGLVAFMETLPIDAASVIEFGEGDKKEKKPTREWFTGFLKNLPKAVDFGERGARAGADADLSSDPLEQAADLSRRALEFQEAESKAGRSINIAQAVAHVKAKAEAAA